MPTAKASTRSVDSDQATATSSTPETAQTEPTETITTAAEPVETVPSATESANTPSEELVRRASGLRPAIEPTAGGHAGDGSYVLPIVHTHVPAAAVEIGFWGGLAGAAVLGVVNPPLAVAVGAGVIIARHRHP